MLEAFRGRSWEYIQSNFRWNLPERFNIGTDCSDRQPAERLAMLHVDEGGRTQEVRYGDLRKESSRLANALSALGIRAGDRVGVVLPQHPRLVISHIAIYKLGAVAVPMTTLFGPDAFLARLKDSSARVVITDELTNEKIAPLRESLPDLQRIVIVERDWDSLLANAAAKMNPINSAADDPALLIYTSGTTGNPKGVLLAHRILLGHLPGFELSHEFYGQPGDRFWTPADWAWIGGLYDAVFPVLHHASTIVSFSHVGSFDPEQAVSMIARLGIRNVFLPPTALRIMKQYGGDAWRPDVRLRTIMSGGEKLGQGALEWARASLGVTVNEIYGQTECNYVIGNSSALVEVRPGSMGKAYIGHQVAILDENDQPTRDLGEIAIQRPDPSMFLGYWNRPDATRARYSGDWMRTGDTGRVDDDGYFWFESRNDDIITSSGYRIGPSEIEECLRAHPAVAQAAVVGFPDPVRGEVVKAFVVTTPGRVVGESLRAELQQFVRSRLATYEYPRVIEFVSELPMTTTGKVRRAALRVGAAPDEHGLPQEEVRTNG